MQIITIMVATVDCKIATNRLLLDTDFHEGLRMLVVNQKIENKKDLAIDRPFCRTINIDGKGLAKNRNTGLFNISSGHVLIADDDVSYVNDFELKIREGIKEYGPASIFTFRIQTPEGGPYKAYRNEGFTHNWRSILKVSSISVVLNIECLRNNNLYFDEDFGLGSNYPTGEENIFLNDALKKGMILKSVPETIVIHPLESSGSRLTNRLVFSKGAMFRRLYGAKGILFLFYFVMRKTGYLNVVKVFMRLKHGIMGFLDRE